MVAPLHAVTTLLLTLGREHFRRTHASVDGGLRLERVHRAADGTRKMVFRLRARAPRGPARPARGSLRSARLTAARGRAERPDRALARGLRNASLTPSYPKEASAAPDGAGARWRARRARCWGLARRLTGPARTGGPGGRGRGRGGGFVAGSPPYPSHQAGRTRRLTGPARAAGLGGRGRGRGGGGGAHPDRAARRRPAAHDAVREQPGRLRHELPVLPHRPPGPARAAVGRADRGAGAPLPARAARSPARPGRPEPCPLWAARCPACPGRPMSCTPGGASPARLGSIQTTMSSKSLERQLQIRLRRARRWWKRGGWWRPRRRGARPSRWRPSPTLSTWAWVRPPPFVAALLGRGTARRQRGAAACWASQGCWHGSSLGVLAMP